MKVSFFSNYLTHHQIPFSNEMYRILHNDYTFISTIEMETQRKELGWELDESYPYELKVTNNNEASITALRLTRESDVIIVGSAPELYVNERMKCRPDGITLRYSERIYKRGRWRFLSPRGMIRRTQTYFRYHNQKLYMLCASAYTSADLMLLGSYLGKCYKWGYFPETIYHNLDDLIKSKPQVRTEILWSGRLIDWKHPEIAINLAHMLRQESLEFHLTILGSGVDEDKIRMMIRDNKLEAFVNMPGVMSPKQVRDIMDQSNIFLSTSDFQEGWGAVVNEAMNSGCAVVASHAVGSVPYLIQDGINGLIYKNGNINSLYLKVKQLIINKQLCESLGRKAYETIANEWNAEVASKRILMLIDDLYKNGYSDRFQSGPCSKAEIIKNNWYKDN